MKPWVVILIAALCVVLIIAGVTFFHWDQLRNSLFAGPHEPQDGSGMERPPAYVKEQYPPSESTVQSVGYSRTGGMENELNRLTLVSTDTGAELTREYRDRETGEEKTAVYSLPADALDALQTIFRERGVEHWPELQREDWEVLDAPSVSVFFETADRSFWFSDEDIFPDQGGWLIGDVREALEALLPEGIR